MAKETKKSDVGLRPLFVHVGERTFPPNEAPKEASGKIGTTTETKLFEN